MAIKVVIRRFSGGALSLLIAMASLGTPSGHCQSMQKGVWTRDQQSTSVQQSTSKQQGTRRLPQMRAYQPSFTAGQPYESDILLIKPASNAKNAEITEALEEVHGTIVGSIGEGRWKVLIVKTERGKLVETETKLRKNKKFSAMQRNYLGIKGQSAQQWEGGFCEQWHLDTLHIKRAWQYAKGANVKIGILDTGCSSDVPDLRGKTEHGCDALGITVAFALGGPLIGALAREVNRGGQSDWVGHGTQVATTAAARANDGNDIAGVAPDATVEPIVVSLGVTSSAAIIEGLQYAANHGVKIVNISSYQPVAISYANKDANAILHDQLRMYHDFFGGLAIFCSGNDNAADRNQRHPYMIMVGAINEGLQHWEDKEHGGGSTHGNPVWFAAPGTNIRCTNKDGTTSRGWGTSFAAPIVAGIAALVWSVNPSLRNTDVEQILINSCVLPPQDGKHVWSYDFWGYGVPDAENAVRLASGLGKLH